MGGLLIIFAVVGGAAVICTLAGLVLGTIELVSARPRQERPVHLGRLHLLEGWNDVYLHHALDGEDPVMAVRRADKWAMEDLGGPYYDVSCDTRLSHDVRVKLGAALAEMRSAAPRR